MNTFYLFINYNLIETQKLLNSDEILKKKDNYKK